MDVDRLVVGAGLFGCYAALSLADRGLAVVLADEHARPLMRASYVNQARLHTGLHYPRSILTGMEALKSYHRFRSRFPNAIHDFKQIYAVSRHGSKTSAAALEAYARRLGLTIEKIDVDRWFRRGTIEDAFVVEEPSFDSDTLRATLVRELNDRSDVVSTRFASSVVAMSPTAGGIRVELSSGEVIRAAGVVLAAYANLNGLRNMLGLAPLPLAYELTEVVLGRLPDEYHDMGITVIDGPFWSYMPFGHSGLISLTSVGLTPLARSSGSPEFGCQALREDCSPLSVRDCNTCPARPASLWEHQVQQMSLHFPAARDFRYERSLWTTKTILNTAEVDDARPTFVRAESDLPVWTVLSGKVSGIFDLEVAL